MNDTELYHYGIPKRSGRYPYGSGKRPFQSIKGPIQKYKRKKQEKMIESKKKANLQKAREVKAQRQLHEQEKARALREGSASDVLKFRGELTNQQLNEAAERIRLTNTIQSYSDKELSKAVKKIDKTMGSVKMATGWTKTAIETYNTLAMLYNATAEGKKKPWSYIRQENKKKDKKD